MDATQLITFGFTVLFSMWLSYAMTKEHYKSLIRYKDDHIHDLEQDIHHWQKMFENVNKNKSRDGIKDDVLLQKWPGYMEQNNNHHNNLSS